MRARKIMQAKKTAILAVKRIGKVRKLLKPVKRYAVPLLGAAAVAVSAHRLSGKALSMRKAQPAIVTQMHEKVHEAAKRTEKKLIPIRILRTAHTKGKSVVSAYIPHNYRAELVSAKELFGTEFALPEEVLRKTRAALVVNGGFFERSGMPSGLFINNGKLVRGIANGRGDGVLYSLRKSGELKLCRATEFFMLDDYKNKNVADAVQLNLLSSGHAKYYHPKTRQEKTARTLVGLKADGSVVLAVHPGATFAEADGFMRGKHGCVKVAALDGGSSSALGYWGKDGKVVMEVQGIPVANFLVIRYK